MRYLQCYPSRISHAYIRYELGSLDATAAASHCIAAWAGILKLCVPSPGHALQNCLK